MQGLTKKKRPIIYNVENPIGRIFKGLRRNTKVRRKVLERGRELGLVDESLKTFYQENSDTRQAREKWEWKGFPLNTFYYCYEHSYKYLESVSVKEQFIRQINFL